MTLLNQEVSEELQSRRPELAAEMVAREFVRHPERERRDGKAGREKCLEDAGEHLAYLAQAIRAENQALFHDYIGWAKVMRAKRGIPAADLEGLLVSMKESLRNGLPRELGGLAGDYLESALQRLPLMPDETPSFLMGGAPLAAQYLQALLRGERHMANKLILDAVQQGAAVREIYLQVFEPAQHEIGRLWQMNQISVAQEHFCTAATQQIMSQLYPHIFGAGRTRGTLVATCVSGDLHEIGVRMVCDLFEMDGWHTHYLGANAPTPSVVQTLIEEKATVLAVSATITYHVRAVEALIAAVRRAPECSGVKILVGGYPFKIDPNLWQKVGADGTANDAEKAVDLANRLTGNPPLSMHLPMEESSSLPRARAEVRPPERESLRRGQEGQARSASEHRRRDDHLFKLLSSINNDLVNAQRELARKNAELVAEIAARQQAEAALETEHRERVELARRAGMAEIAISVMHNVGNVLNSVNVSASIASDKIRDLKLSTLNRLAELLGGQEDLQAFFASDQRGAEVPAFLTRLVERLETERTAALGELGALRQRVEHINEIVATQQNYAKACGLTEILPLAELLEDALRFSAGAIERHGVEIVRDYTELPAVPVDRHKVVQILVNLISNAKHALAARPLEDKRLTLRLARNGVAGATITVSDNGIGIPAENLTRIFQHGFTTRKEGHGFGLHSSANAAREMGGSLTARSAGPGRGADFTLEIPLRSPA